MSKLINTLVALAASTVLDTSAFAQVGAAQSAAEDHSLAPFVAPIENEPAPKLIVNAPLPDALARGVVLIPYRVENIRILPVVGADAAMLSPRVGHFHITVDDLPWHWGEFSDTNTIVVAGLPAGQHKVLIELADPQHHVISGHTVTFTVPGPV